MTQTTKRSSKQHPSQRMIALLLAIIVGINLPWTLLNSYAYTKDPTAGTVLVLMFLMIPLLKINP